MPERIQALVEEVDRLVEEVRTLHEHYEKFGRRVNRWLAALVLTSALGVIVTSWLLFENAQRADEIQRSREDITLSNCRNQNQRNANTKELVMDSESLQERSKPVIVEIIESLVPKQDCGALVDRVDIDG